MKKPFSKKHLKADLKEYSNHVTKLVNDYILSHPRILHEVIEASKSFENEDELYFWMRETLERNTPDIRKVWLDAPGDDVINWKELAWAWFNVVKRDEPLPGEFDINKLPVLDKNKKLDELLDSLSKETDPVKQEQIKQHITRIKNAKLLKARQEEAICPTCGNWAPTDFTPEELQEREWECSDCMNKRLTNPEDLPENRGQKEISKYSPEYDFLKRLINLVVKEGVPPEEIKALSLSSPFQTIDDLGDLTAKIWTLATEKYHIPRQWLIKKLPERKLKSDLWPGQEASQPGTQAPWNYYAYTYGQDKDDSVSGPRPDDVEKKSSPETDHALAMSIGEDIINEYFFQKNIRWSQVVQFIKDQAPQLSDADIVNLKTDTQYKLEQYKIQINSNKKQASSIIDVKGKKVYYKPTYEQIKGLLAKAKYHTLRGLIDPLTADFYVWDANDLDHHWVAEELGIDLYNLPQAIDSYLWFGQDEEDINHLYGQINKAKKVKVAAKKKGLSLDKVLQILEQKGPKPIHVDYTDLTVELEDGSKLSFDEATKKAVELSKSGSVDKKAFEQSTWIAPDGEIFDDVESHIDWIYQNWSALKDEGIKLNKNESDPSLLLIKSGYIRIFSSGNELSFQIRDLNNPPTNIEDYFQDQSTHANNIVVEDLKENYVVISHPEYGFAKGIQKAKHEKRGSAESEEQERNKDAGTGFYDSPNGYQFGKRPQGDESIWPADTWLPRGTEELDSQTWDNIAASLKKPFSKKAFLKISKPKSGYVDNGIGYTCGRCEYFNPEKEKCKLVEGTIKSFGCCNFWDGGDKEANTTKGSDRALTKEEAVYVQYHNVDYRCDECVFFDPKAKTCTKVEGEISPTASCNLWQPMSKKESNLNKKANPPSRFWIAPDGKRFPVAGFHGTWVEQNPGVLKSYGIEPIKDRYGIGRAWDDMINSGWVRISNEPSGTGFGIDLKDLRHIPAFLDDFIAENFTKGEKIAIGNSTTKEYVEITDPFPSIQKAVNKALRNPVHAMRKKADVSGKQINDILALIEQTGGATYNLQSGNLAQTPMFAVSTHKDRERIVDLIDYDTLEGYIVDNQDLLNSSDNSLGAWSHDGKVFLDVVSTVSSKEEALKLAHDNQQLAIFYLKTMTELPVGIPAFSKKELNIVKKAEESALPQNIQDEIAAKWSPAMNILLNNYVEAKSRGHDRQRSFDYAYQSIQNLDTNITEKQAMEAINTYTIGLA